jgi:hypothetical protein
MSVESSYNDKTVKCAKEITELLYPSDSNDLTQEQRDLVIDRVNEIINNNLPETTVVQVKEIIKVSASEENNNEKTVGKRGAKKGSINNYHVWGAIAVHRFTKTDSSLKPSAIKSQNKHIWENIRDNEKDVCDKIKEVGNNFIDWRDNGNPNKKIADYVKLKDITGDDFISW